MKILIKVYSENDSLDEFDFSCGTDEMLSIPENSELMVGDTHFSVYGHFVSKSRVLSFEISNQSEGVLIRFGGVIGSTIGMAASFPKESSHVEVVVSVD